MPAIVIVPMRGLELLLFVVRNVMVPGPVPVAPVMIVIHESLGTDVHAHPAVVVIVTAGLVVAFDGLVILVGLIE